jgi:hypothetical protein
LLSNPPLAICNRFELDIPPSLPHHVDAACIEPAAQILTLADIEQFEITTTFDDGFNSRARDSDTAADTQVAEFEEVQGNAAEGRV